MERIQLAINEAQLGNSGYQKLTEENLQKEIDEQFGSGEVKVYANEKNAFSFIFQNKEANYRLEKDGTLNKIDIALKIYAVDDFKDFMTEINDKGNTFENQYVYLMENMDLTGVDWDVIGSYTDDTTNNAFAGIFEGNNRTINGLNIERNGETVGLFAYNTGTIRDVILESGSITGQGKVGGIVSINNGTIENCHNKGVSISIIGNNHAGGGIAARNGGEIIYCSNLADITSEISGYVGGICGVNVEEKGKITNSYNDGNIKAVYDVGGIAGGNENGAKIEYCYNLGDVTGTGRENDVGRTYSGGITGNTFGKINGCYNVGNIKCEYAEGGGIVGAILRNGEINNCYNIGEVYNNGFNIGNIVGAAYDESKVSNCYCSREICDLDGVGGIGGTTLMETIEENISYMKTSSFVNDLNKDEEAFTISSGLNDGYPVLKWQVE